LTTPLSYIPEGVNRNLDTDIFSTPLDNTGQLQGSAGPVPDFENNIADLLYPPQPMAEEVASLSQADVAVSQDDGMDPHRRLIKNLQQSNKNLQQSNKNLQQINKELRHAAERSRQIIGEARRHADRLIELEEGLAGQLAMPQEHLEKVVERDFVLLKLRNSLF
jgi:septal ring factor EnvC (AmiA/AmiB activator)